MKTKEEIIQMLEEDVIILRKELSGIKYGKPQIFSHLMGAYSLLLHYQDAEKGVTHEEK